METIILDKEHQEGSIQRGEISVISSHGENDAIESAIRTSNHISTSKLISSNDDGRKELKSKKRKHPDKFIPPKPQGDPPLWALNGKSVKP